MDSGILNNIAVSTGWKPVPLKNYAVGTGILPADTKKIFNHEFHEFSRI